MKSELFAKGFEEVSFSVARCRVNRNPKDNKSFQFSLEKIAPTGISVFHLLSQL